MSNNIGTMPKNEKKLPKIPAQPPRPVGRPKVEVATEVLATRVHPDFVAAVGKLAERNRRTNSAELGVAVENLLLANESLLRRLGVWTKEMDKLKAERLLDEETDE